MIDRHLREIRDWNDGIERADRRIAEDIRHRDVCRARKAQLEGRVAFLEGRPIKRNPYPSPFKQQWSKGWTAESKGEKVAPPLHG